MPLLSRLVIKKLNLLARVDGVNDIKSALQHNIRHFSLVLIDSYTIRLKPNAQLYAVHALRILVPLLPKVNEKLDRLLRLGLIYSVNEPTEWRVPIVVVPKSTGISLCIDLSKLSDSILWERHILPTFDKILALLADAKIFSKLDCNSAFLQILPSSGSQLLTTFITPMGCFCFRRVLFGISSTSEHYTKNLGNLARARRHCLPRWWHSGFRA